MFVMIFNIITYVTIGDSPNTAFARGNPKNPLLENTIQKRIISCLLFSSFFTIKNADKKNNPTVNSTPNTPINTIEPINLPLNDTFKVLDKIRNGIPTYVNSLESVADSFPPIIFPYH